MARRKNRGRIPCNSGESSSHTEGQVGLSLVDGSIVPETPNPTVPTQSAGSSQVPTSTTNSRTSTERIYVHLRGVFLEPSEVCSRAIRQSFEERQDYEWFTWKKVSGEIKTFYFCEFKKSFYWDEEIYIVKQVYKAWNKKASGRYSDMLSDIKKGKEKPEYMEAQTYERWLEF